MPPELTAALTALAIAAAAGITQLIRAVVNNQIKRMETEAKKREQEAEDARKEREAKRQIEMEAMRRDTAKAQEDAAQAQAMGKNLTDLTATMIKMIDSNGKEAHANRVVLTNNTQTVGDLAESVDKVATAVVNNTSATKATAAKVETVVAAVEHLEKILNAGIEEIKLMLAPPPPPNVTEINTAPEVKTDVA